MPSLKIPAPIFLELFLIQYFIVLVERSEWDRGLPRNRHGAHIVVTLPIRLLGVDDPCFKMKSGNFSCN